MIVVPDLILQLRQERETKLFTSNKIDVNFKKIEDFRVFKYLIYFDEVLKT